MERLERRELFALSPIECNGVGYFADSSHLSVQRYDIGQEKWLTPVMLTGAVSAPTALHVDSDKIYVAYDKAVYRYDLSGASRRHLMNANSSVLALHSDANLLFVNNPVSLYAKVTSISKSTNTIVDTMDSYINAIGGSSIVTSKNRMLGRSIGISPADLTYINYSDAGKLLMNGDSPYHGDFDNADKTWVFKDERYVVDSSGHVYATDSLLHSGRLGTHVTDIDFFGGSIPIVLSGKTLTSYSTGFLPIGSLELTEAAQEIFVNNQNTTVFRQNAALPNGYTVEKVSVNLLPNTATRIDSGSRGILTGVRRH